MKTNLRSARKLCALTQGDIARSMHVSVQTVFKWEDGRAPVARKHWEKLASLLHIHESDMEKVLVQTLLDGCIARGDVKALINAEISRLYSATLIYDAVLQWEETMNTNKPSTDKSTDELEKLHYERMILERDRKIFELEQQVAALQKELERARPAESISSTLNIEPLKHEVSHE